MTQQKADTSTKQDNGNGYNPGGIMSGQYMPKAIQENTKGNFPLLHQVAPFDHSVYNDENGDKNVDMFCRLSQGQATRALLDPRADGFTVNAAAFHSPELALLALHHPLSSKRTVDIARIQHGPDHEPSLAEALRDHPLNDEYNEFGVDKKLSRGVLPDMHSKKPEYESHHEKTDLREVIDNHPLNNERSEYGMRQPIQETSNQRRANYLLRVAGLTEPTPGTPPRSMRQRRKTNSGRGANIAFQGEDGQGIPANLLGGPTMKNNIAREMGVSDEVVYPRDHNFDGQVSKAEQELTLPKREELPDFDQLYPNRTQEDFINHITALNNRFNKR